MHKQIIRERNLMACLDHPNICKLHATYKTADSLMLLLEPCMGGELYSYMREQARAVLGRPREATFGVHTGWRARRVGARCRATLTTVVPRRLALTRLGSLRYPLKPLPPFISRHHIPPSPLAILPPTHPFPTV